MEMTKSDYRRFCDEYEGGAFAGGTLPRYGSSPFQTIISFVQVPRTKPINPSLDLQVLAMRLLDEWGL